MASAPIHWSFTRASYRPGMQIAPGQTQFWTPPLACAFLCALAVAMAGRHFLMANTDVSWLITVAEKMLDGARLYVDVQEPNPPMSIYIYLPAVALGRLTGLPPETALDELIFATGFASVLWSARLQPQDSFPATTSERRFLAPVAFAVLTILPAVNFGQREHIALIAFLPWLALTIRRAQNGVATMTMIVVAGLCGGLVLSIKPHFALAFAASACVAAASARSWRILFAPENFIAGAIVILYLAHIPMFYPAYGHDLRPIIELYLSVRTPISGMLFGAFPALALEVVALGAFLALTHNKAALAPWILTMAAAIAGFAAAAIAQGKGWPYHFLPALALTTFLLCGLAAQRPATGRMDALLAAVAAAFFIQSWRWEAIGIDMAPVNEKILALKSHPRIMTMASDPAISFPTTRAVGGVWADQAFTGWVPYYAAGIAASDGFDPARLPALRSLVETQRRALASDLRNRRIDILLIERKPFDYLDWGRRDPEVSGLLDCFARRGSTTVGDPDQPGGGVEVEVRAKETAPPAEGGCSSSAGSAR